jgi:copper chaperone
MPSGALKMKFSMKTAIHADEVSTIEHAMKSVDADAKVNVDVGAQTVSVDSWLMPEEFLVAFYDEDMDVAIKEW